MDLLQLRYFIAVAETEHVTHAAESLNVAQPALTKTIKKFEKEIGFPLFERKGRGITLSKCGKYLYDYVAEAVKVIERAPGAVARFASDIKDVVKLNVLAASDCVTTAIIDYKKSHACDVVFSVVQNNAISDADIAIYTDTKRANGADVANFCEDIMLAVPEKKDYSGLKKIELDKVRNESFVCLQGNKGFRTVCDNLCRAAGFIPDITFESDNPRTVRNLIAEGNSVGFWPRYTWGDVGEGIKLLKIECRGAKRYIVIRLNESARNNKSAIDFADYLKGYFKNLFER